MKEVLIYTKDVCPYCVKAKFLLQRKKVSIKEIKVNSDAMREEMIKKSGGRMTVPQIFIDDVHVGGCDDLYALEEKGELDKLLNS